jgi:hypothetical protein
MEKYGIPDISEPVKAVKPEVAKKVAVVKPKERASILDLLGFKMIREK